MIDHTLLKKIFAVTKIPLQLYEDAECTYTSGGFEPTPASLIIKCAVNSPHDLCYTVVYEHQYYGMVRIGENKADHYILVGPVMSQDCTRSQAKKIILDLQQPISRIDDLIFWMNSTPLCDLQRFNAMLLYLDYQLNGISTREAAYIPYIKSKSEANERKPKPDFLEHFNNAFEKEIVSCVEYGRPERLEPIFSKMGSGDVKDDEGVPMIASDAVRAFKNIIICAVGIASRAALKGGLDYGLMIQMVTRYLVQIETLDQYAQLFPLFKKMFLDFARKTAQARLSLTHTAVVNNISKTVLGRIYEKITPTLIAEALNMNLSYLCAHFKRETGKTISEYINEVKITECKRLLETTDLPISHISEQLGYASQSYLITVFKKITGKTPFEYRKHTV